jgi:hypothetical protein
MTLFLTSALGVMMLLALVYGFTGKMPKVDSRPLQGVALICLGMAAIWVPVEFSIASILVGSGIRMVWLAWPIRRVIEAEIVESECREIQPANIRCEVKRVGGE